LIVTGVVGNQARNRRGRRRFIYLIRSLTADELKYTNPTATAGGQIHQAWKRAPTVAATN
jgi:hypothetical protein